MSLERDWEGQRKKHETLLTFKPLFFAPMKNSNRPRIDWSFSSDAVTKEGNRNWFSMLSLADLFAWENMNGVNQLKRTVNQLLVHFDTMTKPDNRGIQRILHRRGLSNWSSKSVIKHFSQRTSRPFKVKINIVRLRIHCSPCQSLHIALESTHLSRLEISPSNTRKTSPCFQQTNARWKDAQEKQNAQTALSSPYRNVEAERKEEEKNI